MVEGFYFLFWQKILFKYATSSIHKFQVVSAKKIGVCLRKKLSFALSKTP